VTSADPAPTAVEPDAAEPAVPEAAVDDPRWRRRVAAYGVARDRAGRILLVRGRRPDHWTLPGGTVAHGESPQVTVARLTVGQTGLTPRVRAPRAASADQVIRPDGVTVHHDRLVFDLSVPLGPGGPRSLRDGARWISPDDLRGLYLPAYAAGPLGSDANTDDPDDPDDAWTVRRGMAMDGSGPNHRVQRFSTYARVTDPAGRVLLARIASGYPSAGRWHLPGGGTDVGEAPAEALLREVTEETGQRGRVGRLLSVSHRHNPVARGWEGYPINWHTIRVVYEMTVDEPTEPRVTEAAGGSTVEAAWMRPAEVDRQTLTDLAAAVL
jgi:ADP-ribose pyrophosphatase YjhB (NUDIX family)